MNTLEAIGARKSTRSYQQKPVEEDKIEQLLIAANNAPKAGVLHISVVENQEVLKCINDLALKGMKNSGNDFMVSRASLDGYQPLYSAPVLFVFSMPEGAPYREATASCAATSLIIAATELELGSCYVVTPLLGIGSSPKLRKEIGIPEDFTPVCCAIVGYADGNAFEAPKSQSKNVNYCR
ncbi:nitroreductase family protein [Faecalicatena contorta]|uniref:Nitroreductase n=1 Tax=Faecalicatena contorta TaxID=39482 RepID=A0A315ZMP3_9FIRM|nr:nitroreductase family protein [Faecalicatena contorta]PWJ46413.1 nitroreductase [Faecalicatena contorta]SUQ16392.1 Nitroreductase [Faecalicatena contorta]